MNHAMKWTMMAGLAVVMLGLARPANAADLTAAGRAKAQEIGDAIVTVKIVSAMKFSWGGQPGEEEELTNEARGTVVSEDGVTVISLAEIDPAQFWMRMMGGEFGDEVKYESSLKDMKLLMSDGTEIPAEAVLRDNDLDVAVIRPKEKQAKKFTFVDLKQSASADILDPLFSIGRMGPVGQRQIRVMSSEVQGVVKRPRLFYVPDPGMGENGTGVPVFNAQGQLIGIVLMKSVPSSADSMRRSSSDSMMSIILPAEDVVEIVSQAPEKAPAEEKKDEPKADAEPTEGTTE